MAIVSSSGGGNSRQFLFLSFEATLSSSGGGNSRQIVFWNVVFFCSFKLLYRVPGKWKLSPMFMFVFCVNSCIEFRAGGHSRQLLCLLFVQTNVSSSRGGNSRQFIFSCCMVSNFRGGTSRQFFQFLKHYCIEFWKGKLSPILKNKSSYCIEFQGGERLTSLKLLMRALPGDHRRRPGQRCCRHSVSRQFVFCVSRPLYRVRDGGAFFA
jgi:hypothetical protein